MLSAEEYVERAMAYAVGGATTGVKRLGGTYLGSDSWQDDHGHWLQVRATLHDLPDVEVRYARVLVLASGPDKDPETEGIVYSSGLEERLHTRAREITPADGVITL